MIVRPELFARTSGAPARTQTESSAEIAQVFVVPICSTLSLDGIAYEQFLAQSGVLDEALHYLARLSLTTTHSVDTARRQVQALVMAAEVQHIVDGMSA